MCFSWKAMAHLSYEINVIPADYLETQTKQPINSHSI